MLNDIHMKLNDIDFALQLAAEIRIAAASLNHGKVDMDNNYQVKRTADNLFKVGNTKQLYEMLLS
jgi:hypothetical protein